MDCVAEIKRKALAGALHRAATKDTKQIEDFISVHWPLSLELSS